MDTQSIAELHHRVSASFGAMTLALDMLADTGSSVPPDDLAELVADAAAETQELCAQIATELRQDQET